MQDITLQTKSLQKETGLLSPQGETELLSKLNVVESENSALKDELAELKQQRANLKKMFYG